MCTSDESLSWHRYIFRPCNDHLMSRMQHPHTASSPPKMASTTPDAESKGVVEVKTNVTQLSQPLSAMKPRKDLVAVLREALGGISGKFKTATETHARQRSIREMISSDQEFRDLMVVCEKYKVAWTTHVTTVGVLSDLIKNKIKEQVRSPSTTVKIEGHPYFIDRMFDVCHTGAYDLPKKNPIIKHAQSDVPDEIACWELRNFSDLRLHIGFYSFAQYAGCDIAMDAALTYIVELLVKDISIEIYMDAVISTFNLADNIDNGGAMIRDDDWTLRKTLATYGAHKEIYKLAPDFGELFHQMKKERKSMLELEEAKKLKEVPRKRQRPGAESQEQEAGGTNG
ncbi:hypothetical protein BDV96DRAFT_689480 [Lophiotrema nucula]|uniref:BTB domain-containing protein n=1 Tax=Lophiotrema nucula TaxID=690887 RepID=A0A6A5Z1H9_9PLEO|nr:hypothetical protein BDV96DRAFT_689480 [Lophiotrema nucula]